ncbi:MAG: hypothetical protein BZY88_08710 [SAR202 cluster bacterium Io17-Chloro-G9]|nr:MAG: hypothetical protein BZY88_08710 [SAR202 cluster bacterium Io17-Chloro-G9]
MADIDDFRKQKDEFFAQGHGSPLEHDQQRDFSGLDYFPENPSLRFEVDPERFDNPEEVRMTTSTGDIAEFRRWGQVRFFVDGQIAELALYQDIHQGHLFVPFTDATSGTDTYGAGRYLDPVLLEDGRVSVDLNYAYNPYCAYNDHWSCPIPPAENHLAVPIHAGEKNFPGVVGAGGY